MSDGLVRKSDVRKIISTYLAECINGLESAEECLRVLQYGIDLNMLVNNMKEVKDE